MLYKNDLLPADSSALWNLETEVKQQNVSYY